jgi:hypothetical protein
MFIITLSIIIIIITIIIIIITGVHKTLANKFRAVVPNSLVPQNETGSMSPFCGPLTIITVSICLRLTGTWAAVSYLTVHLFLCYPLEEQKMFYSITWTRTTKYKHFAGQKLNPLESFEYL